MFQTAPLDGVVWLRIFGVAIVVSAAVAAEKMYRSRRRDVGSAPGHQSGADHHIATFHEHLR
ncbi:hypothetical protein AU194_25080 [Mycobacterium sp. GA-2829]|nr:hypothetical protein AU194_25080 [Mycobacterium sp. GA-2829]